MMRAAFTNLRAGRVAQGGSTLTQQLAKNLFLGSERTYARKLEELVLALWLEVRLGKRDILELYLNRVYFGAGAYGVETAAQRFFGKSAREVTLVEAAVLAGLLKAPSQLFAGLQSAGCAGARRAMCWPRWWRRACCRRRRATRPARRRCASPRPCGRGQSGLDYAVDAVLEQLAAAGRPRRQATSSSRRPSTPTCSAAPRRWCRARCRARDEPPRRARPGSCSSTWRAASGRWSAGAPTRRASSIARSRRSGSPAPPSRRSSTWPRSRAASRRTARSRTCRSSAPAGARATRAPDTAAP